MDLQRNKRQTAAPDPDCDRTKSTDKHTDKDKSSLSAVTAETANTQKSNIARAANAHDNQTVRQKRVSVTPPRKPGRNVYSSSSSSESTNGAHHSLFVRCQSVVHDTDDDSSSSDEDRARRRRLQKRNKNRRRRRYTTSSGSSGSSSSDTSSPTSRASSIGKRYGLSTQPSNQTRKPPEDVKRKLSPASSPVTMGKRYNLPELKRRRLKKNKNRESDSSLESLESGELANSGDEIYYDGDKVPSYSRPTVSTKCELKTVSSPKSVILFDKQKPEQQKPVFVAIATPRPLERIEMDSTPSTSPERVDYRQVVIPQRKNIAAATSKTSRSSSNDNNSSSMDIVNSPKEASAEFVAAKVDILSRNRVEIETSSAVISKTSTIDDNKSGRRPKLDPFLYVGTTDKDKAEHEAWLAKAVTEPGVTQFFEYWKNGKFALESATATPRCSPPPSADNKKITGKKEVQAYVSNWRSTSAAPLSGTASHMSEDKPAPFLVPEKPVQSEIQPSLQIKNLNDGTNAADAHQPASSSYNKQACGSSSSKVDAIDALLSAPTPTESVYKYLISWAESLFMGDSDAVCNSSTERKRLGELMAFDVKQYGDLRDSNKKVKNSVDHEPNFAPSRESLTTNVEGQPFRTEKLNRFAILQDRMSRVAALISNYDDMQKKEMLLKQQQDEMKRAAWLARQKTLTKPQNNHSVSRSSEGKPINDEILVSFQRQQLGEA